MDRRAAPDCRRREPRRPDLCLQSSGGRPEAGQGSFTHGYADYDQPGRVSVYDNSGNVVSRFGASSTDRAAPGNFVAPHGLCLDHAGNLYVAEVTGTYGIRAKRTGPETADHQIQKFARSK